MTDAVSIGVSGLRAFQSALNTVAHNIANVNTEGYSRQTVMFSSGVPTISGGTWGGSGVLNRGIVRQYNAFLASQITSGHTTTKELEEFSKYASRLDDLYADPEVGALPTIQSFFDSLQALATDPGSAAARQLVLSDAQSLADRFRSLNDRTEDIRSQLNSSIKVSVSELQSHADALAKVNDSIVRAKAAGGGVAPPDMLDQRDQLVNEIAKLTGIRTVEQEDGALNLFIGNGIPLVVGSLAQRLDTKRSDSDSGALDITISQTGAGAQTTITEFLKGGRMGGLTRFQNEILNPAQNQLGLVALGIAEQINEQHKLGVDLNGDLGGNFFTMQGIQANPNGKNTGTGEIDLNIENVGNLTGDEYRLAYAGGTYQLTRLSDSKLLYSGAALPVGEVMDGIEGQGFSLNLASGAVNAGDSFLIRPTHNAASNMRLAITDIRKIAAGGGLASVADAGNTGTAKLGQPELVSNTGQPLASLTLTYDDTIPGFNISGPAGTDPSVVHTGSQFNFKASFGDVSFTMQGTPIHGDIFTFDVNTTAPGVAGAIGDNRNAVAMAEMHNQNLMLGGTTTYVGTFSKMVAQVGTETRQAEIAYKAQSNLLEQAQMANSEISGVNLDEEASNLLRFQQAYQAAAQLISVANSTFQSLLAAVRG